MPKKVLERQKTGDVTSYKNLKLCNVIVSGAHHLYCLQKHGHGNHAHQEWDLWFLLSLSQRLTHSDKWTENKHNGAVKARWCNGLEAENLIYIPWAPLLVIPNLKTQTGTVWLCAWFITKSCWCHTTWNSSISNNKISSHICNRFCWIDVSHVLQDYKFKKNAFNSSFTPFFSPFPFTDSYLER